MVRQILAVLFAFILIALIVIWILSGGPRKVFTEVRTSFGSPVETDESGFRFPWQPAEVFQTLDITELMDIAADGNDNSSFGGGQSSEERLRELEAEYDRLRGEASRSSLNPPSPHAGKIGFAPDTSGVRASDPREETLQIVANYTNSEAIDIAGWTLQSALSGAHIQIPFAASPYLSGGSNSLGSVMLEPGAIALVASALSPVGLSFRENICSGYLQQFQKFEPPLLDECPSPSSVLPLTEQNLQRYGDACFDMVRNIPECRFTQSFPDATSPACRAFVSDVLSYNGCVRDNRFRQDFQKNSWRLFLGSSQELWRNGHDAIRLLDNQGQTVSVFVY